VLSRAAGNTWEIFFLATAVCDARARFFDPVLAMIMLSTRASSSLPLCSLPSLLSSLPNPLRDLCEFLQAARNPLVPWLSFPACGTVESNILNRPENEGRQEKDPQVIPNFRFLLLESLASQCAPLSAHM